MEYKIPSVYLAESAIVLEGLLNWTSLDLKDIGGVY